MLYNDNFMDDTIHSSEQIIPAFLILAFSFQEVLDISEVRVEGLETLDYLDNLQNKERFTEQGDASMFKLEIS
ncbi:hypothetical protein RYX36_014929 [Vicia faba]